MDWGDFLPSLTAFALAIIALLVWRIQLIGQRRFSIAEEAIVAFSLARNTLNYARNGASFEGEGETREPDSRESDGVRRLRNAYYTPVERITAAQERFARLEHIMLQARHHLGESAYDAFHKLLKARNRVFISAGHLIRHAGRDEWTNSDSNRKLHLQCESDIWATKDERDRLSVELDDAEATLRKLCDKEARVTAALWPFRMVPTAGVLSAVDCVMSKDSPAGSRQDASSPIKAA